MNGDDGTHFEYVEPKKKKKKRGQDGWLQDHTTTQVPSG